MSVTSKKVPYLVSHDGRTIRYCDPIVKANDTVKVDIATGKILDTIHSSLVIPLLLLRERILPCWYNQKIDVHKDLQYCQH